MKVPFRRKIDTDVATGETSLEVPNEEVIVPAISRPRLAIMTAGMMLIVFLMNLDHYILATAIPQITTQFNSLYDAGWYSSGYYLTNMALLPTFGQIYARFPSKWVYLCAIICFEIGSMICALAPSSAILILGRCITGAGGGGLYVGTVVIIGLAVPLHRRPIYYSVVTTLDAVASAIGPILGGVFVESNLTWRFCFWINLPIGGIAGLIILTCFRDDEKQDPVVKLKDRLCQIDWVSPALLLSAFSMILLSFGWASTVFPWSKAIIWSILLAGVLLFGVYLVVQYGKGNNAAIPYRVLRHRIVFSSSIFMLFISMFIALCIYWLPWTFQAARGASAKESALLNLAFLMSLMFSPLISGVIMTQSGHYMSFLVLGSMIAIAGSVLMVTFSRDKPDAWGIGAEVLLGLGGGITHQIPYITVQASLPKHDLVIGSTLCSFLNSLGSIFGIILGQALFSGLLIQMLTRYDIDAQSIIQVGTLDLARALPGVVLEKALEAYEFSLSKLFILAAVLGTVCLLCSLFMMPKSSPAETQSIEAKPGN